MIFRRKPRSYYDELAKSYDASTSGDAWTTNRYLHSDLVKLAAPPRDALDLGAGTGQTSAVIAELFPDASITAVDFSKEMLAELTAKLPEATVVQADLGAFVRDASDQHELVVAIGCLELMPGLLELIGEMARLTRSGGSLCFTYEPLILGSAVQGAPLEDRGPRRTGFTVHRHRPQDVLEVLGLYGTLAASELFVAYHRSERAPVVYHYLRLTRS